MTEYSESTDLPSYIWLDAFPWLRGVAGASGESPWWESIIDEVGTERRTRHLGRISELAMERLPRWTIGQIFPGIATNFLMTDLQLPARAINALRNHECLHANELAGVTVETIMDWRSVGIGTVDAILRALADFSASATTPSVFAAGAADGESAEAASAEDADEEQLPKWLFAIADDVWQVATWQSTIGKSSQAVLGTEFSPGTPAEIIQARQRLASLTVADVLDPTEVELDAAKRLDVAIGSLELRAAEILSRRLFADDAESLDQLGKRFSITRERVRQIEGKSRGVLLGLMGRGSVLENVALAARSLIDTVRPLDDLLSLMPALANPVPLAGQPAWRVLDRLDNAYEIIDGWCVVPTVSAAQKATLANLQELSDEYGVVRIDDIDLVNSSDPEQLTAVTEKWLRYSGYTVFGEHVFTRTKSVGDYAASVLSVTGTPLSAQAITDLFAVERSSSSLRNALAADDRFRRVDRDSWALAEWGMEAYAGIRSLIRQQIIQEGGTARLDSLVEHIAGNYSVTASSVAAYAAAAPFELRDGVVRVANTDREARKSPERTRRFYRQDAAWLYRVRISGEHLRGSGSVAPTALAGVLDMKSGESRQYDSPLGPQTISWMGIQPTFGTIRRFLLERHIAADTEVFFAIRDDGTFDLEPVPPLNGNPLHDALAMVGAIPEAQNALNALRSAIRLPSGASVTEIIDAYRDRGDNDIAALLLAAQHEEAAATAS